MSGQAPYFVVKGNTPDELTESLNQAAMMGYAPAMLSARGTDMWCLCALGEGAPDIGPLADAQLEDELARAEHEHEARVQAARRKHGQVTAGKAPPAGPMGTSLSAGGGESQGSPVVNTASATGKAPPGNPGGMPQRQQEPDAKAPSLSEIQRTGGGDGGYSPTPHG